MANRDIMIIKVDVCEASGYDTKMALLKKWEDYYQEKISTHEVVCMSNQDIIEMIQP